MLIILNIFSNLGILYGAVEFINIRKWSLNMSYPLYNQQTYMPQAVPTASCGAVSINIMNPTVGMTNPMCQPYQNGVYQYPTASYYSPQPMQMQYPMNYNNNVNSNSLNALPNQQDKTPTPPAPVVGAASADNKEENKTEEKKEELREKIPLTDDYIKTLENYLNSQDAKVRLMAANDLLDRFKEDLNRKNDVALTALLNKILQDPNSAVRFLGLTILDAGYAKGNEQTLELLKAIQADGQKEYGEDSSLATQILLKLSAGDKVKFKPEEGQVVESKKEGTTETTKEAK